MIALPFDSALWWLDIAGLSVFAASGALLAARRQLDLLAAIFFALITATGGGTLRDVLIGAPIFWMQDATLILLCAIVALVVWVVPLRFWSVRTLDWLDAAGLVAYAVYGAAKALQFRDLAHSGHRGRHHHRLRRRHCPGHHRRGAVRSSAPRALRDGGPGERHRLRHPDQSRL